MATTREKWQEIANRGLQDRFDPETRAKFDEAVRRGLITLPEAQPAPEASQAPESLPVQQTGQPMPNEDGLLSIPGMKPLAEMAAAANKSIFEFIDFLGPNNINAVLSLAGSDKRVPTLTETLGSEGGFMEPGLGRDVVQAAGQLAPVAASLTPAVGRNLASVSGALKEALGLGSATPTAAGTQLAEEVQSTATGFSIRNPLKARRILADRIKAGDIDTGTIAKTLDADGKLIKNPNVKKAIKLMGDEDAAYSTAINFEKMNPATKRQINKMLDMIESNKISGDPLDIMKNRPANVVGESIAKRVNKLNSIKQNASKRIGEIVNGDVGKQAVDVRNARDEFINALDQADIIVDINDAGNVVADTSRTLTNIEEVINPKRLNSILDRIDSGNLTASEAHKLKRNLREMVSYDPAKPGSVKVSAEIESAIKKLSNALGESISEISPDYKRANQIMSESLDALKKADSALGNKLMIGDELAESKFGALSKRIGTNLASREQVLDLVKSVDSALAKRGASFGDDIERQVAALADLEKIFKVESAQAPFGFTSRIAQGAAEGIATGGTGGITRDALDFALDKFRGMSKMDFEDRMKALRALSKVNE